MKKIILGLITGIATVQVLLASLTITRMTVTEIALTIISFIWLVLFILVNDNRTSKLHDIKMKLIRR